MTITQLIQLARNRLTHLAVQRSLAFDRGDVAELAIIDNEIAATESTLAKLEAL